MQRVDLPEPTGPPIPTRMAGFALRVFIIALGDEESCRGGFVLCGADIPNGIEAADVIFANLNGFFQMRDEGLHGFLQQFLCQGGANWQELERGLEECGVAWLVGGPRIVGRDV